jgi:hypothetical protein
MEMAKIVNMFTKPDQPGEYAMDADDFFVPATDTKGHSERVICRVIPGVSRQIEEVIQARKFPYKTNSDLIRHALRRHLFWLHELDPETVELSWTEAAIEVLRNDERVRQFNDVMDKTKQAINFYVGIGENQEALKMMLRLRRLVDQAPSGFWRDKYIKEMDTTFGHLEKTAPKAKLWNGKGNGKKADGDGDRAEEMCEEGDDEQGE